MNTLLRLIDSVFPSLNTVWLVAGLVLLGLSLTGCRETKVVFDVSDPLDGKLSGENAFAHVAALVDFGPRPSGSEALEKTRVYLEEQLAASGWTTQRQTFSAKTPDGEMEFVNLRARFGNKAWDRQVDGLLCSHYDTKLYTAFEFVGANDGASSTGLLLEIARVLALRPSVASQIELVFFDGEEALGTNITAKDGLYGSKHYAGEWLRHGFEKRPRWGVLLDMVGDADLNIRAAVRIPASSVDELAKSNEAGQYAVDIVSVEKTIQGFSKELLEVADELEFRKHVGISPSYIIDDHIPLNIVAGIPTIDLIDFDYAPWHTPGDTLDKVSAQSLEITGRVTLRFIEKYRLGKR